MTYYFLLDLTAKPTPRPRVVNNRAFNEKWYTEYLKLTSTLIKKNFAGTPYSGDVSITIYVNKTCAATNQRYGDVDNLAKGILDACTGILWYDDKQVTNLYIVKNTSARDYIELYVTFND